MTVQDFLCLLLWMIEDFKFVRVSFNQSFSALGAFRRGTVLRFQVFSIYIVAWLLRLVFTSDGVGVGVGVVVGVIRQLMT